MSVLKIIVTALVSFLICTGTVKKPLPDMRVTVVIEDDRGSRRAVPRVAVAVTDDTGAIREQAVTDDQGTALFVKTGMRSGQRIRILLRGALPDGTAIFQAGADTAGMSVIYTRGLQQNFVLTRSGRIWPDYLQWDQDASDNTTTPAYVSTAPAGPDNRTRPQRAPYMGTKGQTPLRITGAPDNRTITAKSKAARPGSRPLQSIRQQPVPPTQPELVPPAAAPWLSTPATTAQPGNPGAPPPVQQAVQSPDDNSNGLFFAFTALILVSAVFLIMLLRRKKP